MTKAKNTRAQLVCSSRLKGYRRSGCLWRAAQIFMAIGRVFQ
ncbi:hypothetical protein [Eubacterium aggregans]